MAVLFFILIIVFGACVGSFLNVVILRLPAGEKLTGRSHCPACHRQLNWWELFPLFSYLMLRGRCSFCKVKISSRYFAVELVVALLFAASFFYLRPAGLGGYLTLARYWLFVCAMVVVFAVDLENYLILDQVVLPAAVAAAALNLALDFALRRHLLSVDSFFLGGLFAAVLGAAPFFLIWYFSKGRFMGFGDVKLALLLGILLGWPQVYVCLFVAVILGGLVSVYLLLATSKTLKSQLPFGTFLSFSAILCMFYGERLLSWYLSFLGF